MQVSFKEIANSLSIPERELKWKKYIENYPIESKVTFRHGTTRDGYHGYWETHKKFDPHGSLSIEQEKNSSDQYTDSADYYYDYDGKHPAAIAKDYMGVNNSSQELYIYLPEDWEIIPIEIVMWGVRVPKRLAQKWISEICEKKYRDPKTWASQGTVYRLVYNKAHIYGAYQFLKKHPQDIGLIWEIWRGQTLLAKDGKVEIFDTPDCSEREYIQTLGGKAYRIYAKEIKE